MPMEPSDEESENVADEGEQSAQIEDNNFTEQPSAYLESMPSGEKESELEDDVEVKDDNSDDPDFEPVNHRRRRRQSNSRPSKRARRSVVKDEDDEDEEYYETQTRRSHRSSVSYGDNDNYEEDSSNASFVDTESELTSLESEEFSSEEQTGTRRSARLRNRQHANGEEEEEEEHRPTLRKRKSRPDYRLPAPDYGPDELDQLNNTTTSNSNRKKTAAEHVVIRLLQKQVNNPVDLDFFSDSDDEGIIGKQVGGDSGIKALEDPNSAGGPANFGQVNNTKDLADLDPLGVDKSISFDSVGGLDNHINQLKEMVMLPLLYPEVFLRFNLKPPRGVLFHGPPGTGKTLMARALAATCSTEGKKISFYMRKGADCLSKWIGEAERQLRLLFEEARNTQPSIIFFDEIDGLAPVRSSKQEQIHASIVSTLLALMDGMDGRGQVIVIGATNRPDAVDPALRRPGRFDREFYFPLPDLEARKSIIKIHTKNWDPPLDPNLCDLLAQKTKGYGGADLRALCTEAALNAVKRTFPQIYSSSQKLLLDPKSIQVKVKDFVLSMKRIVPSSQRSAISGNKPLPAELEVLLGQTLKSILRTLHHIMPLPKKVNIMEEAMYDDPCDDSFEYQQRLDDLETLRVYRPRLLICGEKGLGQVDLGPAILQYFEGVHVQSFDLSTLLQDSNQSLESTIIQLFAEVRRHTPGVIYISDIDSWLNVLPESAIATFSSLLESLAPSDPVLFLAISWVPLASCHPLLLEWFPHKRSVFELQRPSKRSLKLFFQAVIDLIAKPPTELPDGVPRKKRTLPELPIAPVVIDATPEKNQLKQTKHNDMRLLNKLKIKLNALLGSLKPRYRKFRKPLIDFSDIHFVDPETGDAQVSRDDCNFELVDDQVRRIGTSETFSMMSLEEVEKRVWDNSYCTPLEFLKDIRLILKDALKLGDLETKKRAQEMYTNVQFALEDMEDGHFFQDCERMAVREAERRRIRQKKLDERLRLEELKEANEAALAAASVVHTPVLQEEEDMQLDSPNTVMKIHMQLQKDPYELIPKVIASKEPPSVPQELRVPTEKDETVDVPTAVPLEPDVAEEVKAEEMQLHLDKQKLSELREQLISSTENYTVDQLERLHASLYKVIWDTRSTWDRNVVISKCLRIAQEVIEDEKAK